MPQKEANIKETVNFKINFRSEIWDIYHVWLMPNGFPAWFEGKTSREGVNFHRTFSPDEIEESGFNGYWI